MKNKLAKTTAIIGLALGSGVIGYAASNAFQDLDTIKANFNTVLQYGQTKSQRVSELESQLSNNTRTQDQLKAEIEQIKSDKQKEIEAKQREIEAKQQEIKTKQQEADSLRQQLNTVQNDKEQLEQRVSELRQYTDQKVGELGK